MATIIYHALNRSYDGSQDIEGDREHVEHYDIGFDSPPDSEVPCYLDSRSPRFGDVHVDDPESFVSSLEASSVDGVKFDLSVTYARNRFSEGNEDPLSRPSVITARSQQRNILTVFDADGNPIRNTAGVMVNAHEKQSSLIIISIRKNLPVTPWPGWLLDLRDVVNQSAIKIKGRVWPKRTLRADNITIPEEVKENDFEFIPLTYELTYKSEGWREPLLNQGFDELEEYFDTDQFLNPRIFTRLKELQGGTPLKPLREPAFLDADGFAYRNADGVLRAKLDDDEILSIDVKDYREVPFSVLPGIRR